LLYSFKVILTEEKMGRYTAYGPEVDAFIKKHYLDKIVEVFVKECNPVAIILFGGFGKGEGSVYFRNGKPVPFNDFDLYVVTQKKLNDKTLNSLSMHASAAIGMGGLEIAYFPGEKYDAKKYFHVDVRCLPVGSLKKLMSIQRYYELKYGSQVIYGDATILEKINPIKKEDLPESDGLRNLFNKLHTLLLGLQPTYDVDSQRIRIFWSYKCYLSICEALLISEKKFEATARKRMEVFASLWEYSFPELKKEIPDLATKIKIATEFKLKPDFSVGGEGLWAEALKDMLLVFAYYVKRMTGVDDVGEAISDHLPFTYFAPFLKEKIGFNFWPSQYILNVGYVSVLQKEGEFYVRPLLQWKDVGLRMILPIYFLLLYKHTTNSFWLDKAYDQLQQFIKTEKKEFWYLRERALKAYGLYYEQRLL